MSKVVEIISEALRTLHYNNNVEEACGILSQLDECKVKVWREDDTVKLPTYGKDGDACMDVYVHKIEYKDDGRVVYHTGLHFALPEDYEMKIRPRSSITKTLALMQNAPGTLDEGYRGELMIVHRQIDDPTNSCAEYKVGDRVAQILVCRRERIVWDEVETQEELGNTERGVGGFGSTGK
jgi:dUTP pyrophosphatase